MRKVTKEFQAVRPGDVYPTVVGVGEDVDGRLAEIAEQLDALETVKTKTKSKKALKGSPENKAN